MSPPPPSSSSSSKGKESETSRKGMGDRLKKNSNPSSGKEDKEVNQGQRGNSFVQSPSGLSLSRPKSLLAPSKPTPLKPSISSTTPNNNQPPHLLSASPSSRSIVDRNHATGITSSVSSTSISNRKGKNIEHDGARSVSDGGALSRLRRMASNASLASTTKRFEPNSKPSSVIELDQESEAVDKNVSKTPISNGDVENKVQQTGNESTNLKATEGQESKATEQDTEMNEEGRKRTLDGNTNFGAQKNQRRRTWFGFMGGNEEIENEGSASRTSLGPDEQNVPNKAQNTPEAPPAGQSVNVADDQDGQKTIRGPPSAIKTEDKQGTIKSKIPWREQEDTADIRLDDTQKNHTNNSRNEEPEHPLPNQTASYTDSLRRYIGWSSSSAADPAPTSSTNSWIWSAWNPYGANPQPSAGNESKAPEESSAPVDPPVSTDARAMELKPDVAKEQTESTASTSSPAQASFVYRWVPTWSRATASPRPAVESESQINSDSPPKEPTTPAEQYKAEALALLDAKGAVLNPATRSTWVNYFSNRSTASQARVPARNLDEPEIMKIENDLPSTSASVRLPSNSGKSTPLTPSVHSKSDAPQKSADSSLNAKRTELDKPKPDPAPANSRPATPLTNNKDVKAQQVSNLKRLNASNAKSAKPTKPAPPNLLLPSFEDTFTTAPRSVTPKKGVWEKTMSLLFNSSSPYSKGSVQRSSILSPASQQEMERKPGDAQARLPRLWSTMGEKDKADSKGCKDIRKVTVIGIHGWFSQGPIRNLFGEPTGTSTKFASMMTDAVRTHFAKAGMELKDEQMTTIALEADGLVSDRVEKSFESLLSNPKWVKDLLDSDAIFLAAHSQGSIVATHLLARLAEQGHLNLRKTKITLLCMCGIHNGPFAHLRGSITSYYMNTFETPAAKELFEFQNGHSSVSKFYAASLRFILAAGIKLVYIASLDDQVVPLYSALHTAASHPSILRGIFCDGAAFPRVDFLTNLLSFCVNVRNAGLGDHHLATLLSSSVAGSLYGGLGHSLVYDEPQVYNLAVRYCLEVTSPAGYPTARPDQQGSSNMHPSIIQNANVPQGIPPLDLDDDFTIARNQKWNSNPYALPWSLRGLFEDEMVRQYFSPQIDKLVRDFLDWQPTTKTLKDVQFRLEPMRFIATSNKNLNNEDQKSAPSRTVSGSTVTPSNSKL